VPRIRADRKCISLGVEAVGGRGSDSQVVEGSRILAGVGVEVFRCIVEQF